MGTLTDVGLQLEIQFNMPDVSDSILEVRDLTTRIKPLYEWANNESTIQLLIMKTKQNARPRRKEDFSWNATDILADILGNID